MCQSHSRRSFKEFLTACGWVRQASPSKQFCFLSLFWLIWTIPALKLPSAGYTLFSAVLFSQAINVSLLFGPLHRSCLPVCTEGNEQHSTINSSSFWAPPDNTFLSKLRKGAFYVVLRIIWSLYLEDENSHYCGEHKRSGFSPLRFLLRGCSSIIHYISPSCFLLRLYSQPSYLPFALLISASFFHPSVK